MPAHRSAKPDSRNIILWRAIAAIGLGFLPLALAILWIVAGWPQGFIAATALGYMVVNGGWLLYRTAWRFVKLPPPSPDDHTERIKWLNSEDPAVRALHSAGVFKYSHSAQTTDPLEKRYKTLDENLKFFYPEFDKSLRHDIKSVVRKRLKTPPGLVDFDHVTDLQWNILDAYRIGTQLLSASLTSPDVSEAVYGEVASKLAEAAQQCRCDLQQVQNMLTKAADNQGKDAIAVTEIYLDRSLELTQD